MQALLRTLERHTREPITSAEELRVVLDAAADLQLLHGAGLPDPWALAKLLSSCLRCAAAAADSGTLAGLSLQPLLAAGFRACPVPALRALAADPDSFLSTSGSSSSSGGGGGSDSDSSSAGASPAEALAAADMGAAARQMGAAGGGGAAVALSLLNMWHHLLLARAAAAEWCDFSCRLYGSMRALWPLCAPATRRLFHEQWLARVAAAALQRSPSRAASPHAEGGLEGPCAASEACALLARASPDCAALGSGGAALRARWAALEAAVLAGAARRARAARERLQGRWAAEVAPHLRAVARAEPPPHDERFFAAPPPAALGPDACAALRDAAHSDAGGDACPGAWAARAAADVGALRAALFGGEGAAERPPPPLADTLRLATGLAALAAQEWRFGAAAELLALWAPHAEWAARLAAAASRDSAHDGPSPPPAASEGQEERALWAALWCVPPAAPEGAPLLPALVSACVRAAGEGWEAALLDVLARTARPERLRVCTEVLLLPPPALQAGVEAALAHPLTPPLLTAGLAALARHALRAGDAPLARAHLAGLAACLSCGPPSAAALAAYVDGLQRLAAALSTVSGLSPLLQVHSREITGAWRALASAAAGPRAPPLRAAADARARVGADDARHGAFAALVASDAHAAAPAPPPGEHTRVTLALEGGALVVSRAELLAGEGAAVARLRVPDTMWLSEVETDMQSILAANKEQLAAGSGGSSGGGEGLPLESARCDAADSPPPSSTSAPPPAADKVLWWARRFALDEEVRHVCKRLQAALGPAALLLLGAPPPAVAAPVRALAADAARRMESLFPQQEQAGRAGEAAERAATLTALLMGLPHLCPRGADFSPRLDRYAGKARYAAPTCLFAPCMAHEEQAAAAHALAEAMSAVWCDDGHAADDATAAALHALSQDLTHSVFSSMHAFLTSPGPSHGAPADLLRLPRAHVCLELPHRLQALPWEGTDALHGRSCSRAAPGRPRRPRPPPDASLSPSFSADVAVYREGAAPPPALAERLRARPGWQLLSAPPAGAEGGESGLWEELRRRRPRAYVYMGHRGGEWLLSRAQLYERVPACCWGARGEGGGRCWAPRAALLMGCGSARLVGADGGRGCDSVGLPLAWLHAGAAAAVGCLWDVTDGDIDRLTYRLLDLAAAGGGGEQPLGAALAAARAACKLPYLTGAATVLFGGNVILSE